MQGRFICNYISLLVEVLGSYIRVLGKYLLVLWRIYRPRVTEVDVTKKSKGIYSKNN